MEENQEMEEEINEVLESEGEQNEENEQNENNEDNENENSVDSKSKFQKAFNSIISLEVQEGISPILVHSSFIKKKIQKEKHEKKLKKQLNKKKKLKKLLQNKEHIAKPELSQFETQLKKVATRGGLEIIKIHSFIHI